MKKNITPALFCFMLGWAVVEKMEDVGEYVESGYNYKKLCWLHYIHTQCNIRKQTVAKLKI